MGKYNIERISQLIRIGWDGENNWRPQTFDCSSLLATRPSGTVTLWILPNGESEAFPVALTTDGNLRTWTPLDSELVCGGGKLQFHCQDGEDVGKSPVYRYVVEDSLLTGAEHPDETPSWAVQVVEDVTAAVDGIEDSIEEMLPGAIEDYLEEHPVTVEETDPTVPAWAKQPSKPTYTAQEVGAMPSGYVAPVTSVNGQTGDVALSIPSKTSDLTNDSGFLTSAPVTSVNGQTGAVVIPLAKPGNTHINVFNPNDQNVAQGYIAAQGQVNSNADYWTTGYIAVSEGDVVRVFYDGANKNHAYAAEYSTTAQSGFISRTDNGSYASYTVQNDGYVRLSVKTSAVPWANISTAMVTINDTDPTFIAYGDMGANDGLMSAADKAKLDGLGESAGKKVFNKFLHIAYSSFGSRAPNAVPHFEYCAQRDYDWLKADVQPTSDGGLVCCHDSGFTLDSNNRITTYDSSNATAIYSLTLAQATALVYASYQTTHVASIDDFLAVCKHYGKTPYITIRDEHMDVVVPALFAALDKFALRSVAVINSSARASLDAVRAEDPDITMSLFVNPFGSSMASGYNYALADGNTMLGYFYTQSSHTWAEFIADSTVAGYLADCIQSGIIMWAGIESDDSHTADLIEMGFSGIHTMEDRPLEVPEVPTNVSAFTNDAGYQTAQQVQTAIENAAELPSGGSAGDFLRKTASGVAWETVPSAESNSFGGGS